MFWTKKSIISAGLLNEFSDIHTHIMWGVDDGMRTVDHSLATLDYYEKHGAVKVCFTPHVMEDLPANTTEFLTQRFEQIKSLYKGNLKLSLGAEYMLDASFLKHLNKGNLLTVGNNKILVETSLMNSNSSFEDILYEIHINGYEIVLAHPERYTYMKMSDYEQLKRKNIYLQLNILSLLGIYGNAAKIKSKNLLNRGMYDFIGSDIHNLDFHAKKYEVNALSKKQICELQRIKELTTALI